MTLVMLSLTPVVISVAIVQSILVAKLTRRVVQHQSKLNGHVAETISAHKTIQSLNVHEEFISKYENYIQPLTKTHLLKGHLNGVTRGLLLLIAIVSYCVGFWYAVTLITSGQLLAGDALSIFVSSVIAANGWAELLSVNSTIASAKGVASGIISVIKRKPSIDVCAIGSPVSLDHDIAFDAVKFKYPSRPTVSVLKKVSLVVKKGKTTAFVGKSGSGKSTIIKLLLRLYDPTKGAIKIGDQDLKSVDLHEYRSQIGYVGQEPVLFEGTIADNIRLGCPKVSLEDVIEACKMAGAHDFITQLDKGYECLISDLGSNLSGGQKQRIAIARALVRKPKLLLFDEASSALDTESEAHIQRTIDSLAKEITTVIVTHRLSSVRHADNIYVVRQGRIVETGNHKQLKLANGYYSKMLKNHSSYPS
jgi:ABC-type multidrug transport system fused ATPase/permease subunit